MLARNIEETMDTDDAEWADRITFRHGAPGEIILRVPREDANGSKAATNHVLTVRQALLIREELCEALLVQREALLVQEPIVGQGG
jgi:hypothetical protein